MILQAWLHAFQASKHSGRARLTHQWCPGVDSRVGWTRVLFCSRRPPSRGRDPTPSPTRRSYSETKIRDSSLSPQFINSSRGDLCGCWSLIHHRYSDLALLHTALFSCKNYSYLPAPRSPRGLAGPAPTALIVRMRACSMSWYGTGRQSAELALIICRMCYNIILCDGGIHQRQECDYMYIHVCMYT